MKLEKHYGKTYNNTLYYRVWLDTEQHRLEIGYRRWCYIE